MDISPPEQNMSNINNSNQNINMGHIDFLGTNSISSNTNQNNNQIADIFNLNSDMINNNQPSYTSYPAFMSTMNQPSSL